MATLEARVKDTTINRLRTDILAHARSKATLPCGVFTLDVPTGGGKILASLGFALDHARALGMERIVYGIPFTGARIETSSLWRAWRATRVTPFAGVWIWIIAVMC
jgi:CRISPR-associated endonuclease/helicase Cas3